MSDFYKLPDLVDMTKTFKVVIDKHLHYMITVETPNGVETYRGNSLGQLKETLATLEPNEVTKVVLF